MTLGCRTTDAPSAQEELMKVVVDFEKCTSNAVCQATAPEVFEVREDNFLYILDENPPESLRAKLEAAARGCPTRAISISED